MFESRDPGKMAWLEWNRDQSYRRAVIPSAGPVETWTDLTQAEGDLVSFRITFVFERDGVVLTSNSTLRFRSRDELADSLITANLVIDELRDAPDRPGREFVFIARRPVSAPPSSRARTGRILGDCRGAAAGMGGRHPPCAHVLVPAGLPAGVHLAGAGHHAGGP